MIEINIRDMKNDDINFILSSWLYSLSKNYPYKYMQHKNYNKKMSDNLLRIIKESSVLVASYTDDDDLILGYLVYEKVKDIVVLHFVFTKENYRNEKIAERLIKSVFPDFGKKECIITNLPNLDENNYNKYLKLNEDYLVKNNLNIKFANVNRYYLMHNNLYYDHFLFVK